jgi:hypothetical protein
MEVINYASTIGDVFWHRFNKTLNNQIYLNFVGLITMLTTFIRHDLSKILVYEKGSSFKNIGLFSSEADFERSADLAKNYGVIESKLVKGICFDSSQANANVIDHIVNTFKEFSIVYDSLTSDMDEKASYYKVILPSMCSASFEMEKTKAIEAEESTGIYFN